MLIGGHRRRRCHRHPIHGATFASIRSPQASLEFPLMGSMTAFLVTSAPVPAVVGTATAPGSFESVSPCPRPPDSRRDLLYFAALRLPLVVSMELPPYTSIASPARAASATASSTRSTVGSRKPGKRGDLNPAL